MIPYLWKLFHPLILVESLIGSGTRNSRWEGNRVALQSPGCLQTASEETLPIHETP